MQLKILQAAITEAKHERASALHLLEEDLLMMKCARHCSFLGRRQVADDDRPSIGEEFRYDIARRLPFLFAEKKLDFGDCNKIFSTSWISEDLVVAGTKCNKVSAPLRFWGVWI